MESIDGLTEEQKNTEKIIKDGYKSILKSFKLKSAGFSDKSLEEASEHFRKTMNNYFEEKKLEAC